MPKTYITNVPNINMCKIKGKNDNSNIHEEYYDENDLDILKLENHIKKHNIDTQRIVNCNVLEEYDTDVNNKQHKKMVIPNNNIKTFIKERNIHQINSYKLAYSKVGSTTNSRSSSNKLNSNTSNRPTTVPLGVIEELINNNTKKKAKILKKKKSIKGGGFTFIKHSRQSPMQTSSKTNIDISTALTNCLKYNVQRKKTEDRPKTFNSEEKILNHIIKLSNITAKSFGSSRPTTAVPLRKTKRRKINRPENRPISAQIFEENISKTPENFIQMGYSKPFIIRQRPISAAINSTVNSARIRMENIRPKVVKSKYLRCLKELELDARKCFIEDNGNTNDNFNINENIKAKRN